MAEQMALFERPDQAHIDDLKRRLRLAIALGYVLMSIGFVGGFYLAQLRLDHYGSWYNTGFVGSLFLVFAACACVLWAVLIEDKLKRLESIDLAVEVTE